MQDRQLFETVVLVKHGLYEPWLSIAKSGQGETWLSEDIPNGMLLIHYYGIPCRSLGIKLDQFHEWLRWHGVFTCRIQRVVDIFFSAPFKRWVPKVQDSSFLKIPGKEIQCQVFDTYFTLKWKQLAAYKYILHNFDFKFLYETNGSSYVQLKFLSKYLRTLPKIGLYGGTLAWEKAEFISGSSRITSRDVLEKIYSARSGWDASLLEDVAFGKLCKKLGISIIPAKSIVVEKVDDVRKLESTEIKNNFHFRTKSGTTQERNDVQLMKAIHKQVLNLRL